MSSANRRYLAAITFGLAVLGGAVECIAQDECLVTVRSATGDAADQGTLCAEVQGKTCVFQLQVCLNQGDAVCAPAPLKKKVKVKGNCKQTGKLKAKPDGSNPVCGSSVDIQVKTKKKGKREGKCKIRVATKSTDRPPRTDVDSVSLVCKPNPGDCPTPARLPTTTTLPPPCIAACTVLPISDFERLTREGRCP